MLRTKAERKCKCNGNAFLMVFSVSKGKGRVIVRILVIAL